MSERPILDPASIEEIETVLNQIAEVRAARVVASPLGLIEEVHILSSPEKNPKQMVRDVESAIHAAFGIPIDHKKISVAQLGHGHITSAVGGAVARPRITGIVTDDQGMRISAQVGLEVEGEEYLGASTLPAGASSRVRLVALATLDALEQYAGGLFGMGLEDVSIVQLGHQRVAVSCVSVVNGSGESTFAGSAIVRRNEDDAIVRATLDAINRRVGRMTSS